MLLGVSMAVIELFHLVCKVQVKVVHKYTTSKVLDIVFLCCYFLLATRYGTILHYQGRI